MKRLRYRKSIQRHSQNSSRNNIQKDDLGGETFLKKGFSPNPPFPKTFISFAFNFLKFFRLLLIKRLRFDRGAFFIY